MVDGTHRMDFLLFFQKIPRGDSFPYFRAAFGKIFCKDLFQYRHAPAQLFREIFVDLRLGMIAETGIRLAEFRQSETVSDFLFHDGFQAVQKLFRIRRGVQQAVPERVKFENVGAGTELNVKRLIQRSVKHPFGTVKIFAAECVEFFHAFVPAVRDFPRKEHGFREFMVEHAFTGGSIVRLPGAGKLLHDLFQMQGPDRSVVHRPVILELDIKRIIGVGIREVVPDFSHILCMGAPFAECEFFEKLFFRAREIFEREMPRRLVHESGIVAEIPALNDVPDAEFLHLPVFAVDEPRNGKKRNRGDFVGTADLKFCRHFAPAARCRRHAPETVARPDT